MKHSGKEKRIKWGILGSVFAMTLCSAGICALAKYHLDQRVEASLPKSVAEYYIDLLDADKATPIVEKLSIENMNPGESKDIIINVANGHKDGEQEIVSQVAMEFSIQVIHTNNLPLTYQVLKPDLTAVPLINTENYDDDNPYYNGGDVQSFDTMIMELHQTLTYDEYRIRITWHEEGEEEGNDSKYVKELDAIYLKVSAWQQEPEK